MATLALNPNLLDTRNFYTIGSVDVR